MNQFSKGNRNHIDIIMSHTKSAFLLDLSKISIFIVILYAFCSMQPWFSWHFDGMSLLPLLFLIVRLPFILSRKRINSKLFISLLVFLIFGFLYCKPGIDTIFNSVRIFISAILSCVGVALFRPKESEKFIKWFILIFCIILAVSIPSFILFKLGVSFPHFQYRHPNEFYPPFDNYIFFLSIDSFLPIERFKSIFTEPGHLGMICSILLYVNGYTLRSWQNCLMWLALILSFSLSGFLLGFIGFIIYKLTTANKPSRGLFLVFGCIASLLIAINNYDENSTDIVSVQILSRLQYDDEKGISGNNRNTDEFNQMYDNFSNSDEYLFGVDPIKYKELTDATANSSYKNFILSNGIITTLILWIFLFLYWRTYPSKVGLGFIILLFLSFIQRPYIMWAAQIYTFLCIIPLFYYNKSKLVQIK